MSTFALTVIIATAAIVICALLIGIGKLLTGSNKFSCKRCGKPEEDKSGCGLCKKNKKNPPSN